METSLPLPTLADLPASLIEAAAAADTARASGTTPTELRNVLSAQGDRYLVAPGLYLQPYSLDHQWLLEEVGSPLVGASGTPGARPGATDIALFLFICTDADRAWQIWLAESTVAGASSSHASDRIAQMLTQARALRLSRGVDGDALLRIADYLNPHLPDAPGKVTGQP